MGKVPKVTLMVQCKVDGIWKKLLAPMSANGRPKNIQGASFYLRYRRKGRDTWEAVEGGPDAAMAAKKRREISFDAEAMGIDIPELRKDANADRLTWEQAVNLYFSDEVPEEGQLPEWNAATEKWSRKTCTAYRRSLRLFRDAHKKTHLQEISRTDLLNLKVHLRKARDRWGKIINERTQHNYFSNVVSFLNAFRLSGLVKYAEFPEYEPKKVTIYSEEQLVRWLEAAELDEQDVVIYYVGSGFRNGEGAHSEYADVNFELKEMEVFSKPEYRYETKDGEHRIVTLSDEVIKMLRARRERQPKSKLVFPNSKGNPDTHMLRIIKRVALRAGLNCGRCVSKTGLPCKDHPVCKQWILHKFRATWACLRERNGMSPYTLMTFLGHSDLETTMKYLTAADRQSEKTRKQVNDSDSFLGAIKSKSAVAGA